MSLRYTGGGIGKGKRSKLPCGGELGIGGNSELSRGLIAIDEDLLTRDESGSHMFWLLLPSELVPSDCTVER